MNYVWAKINRFYPILILLVVEILLFWTNYTPGTYFLGWDNLFPELNFKENIRRGLFAIWQEYRGLGLLDGMSFAANLPHYLFLYLISHVLPASLLRYFFFFLMHFLGGVGVYYLLQELLDTNSKKTVALLFGSLFYLLNIGTIQIFYAPYEVFSVHFAFLPWLILSALRYLKKGLKKDLLLYCLFSILALPQAHVPTLFLIYAFALFTIICFHLLQSGLSNLRRVVLLVAVSFVINAYWGLPYVYSTIKNADIISNSKINQMSTEDIYLKNKVFGNFFSVALLKGFNLDTIDVQSDGLNGYMMKPWRDHIQTGLFLVIGFSFFALAILGMIRIFIKKESRLYPFIFLFVISFLMLANNTPILELPSQFLTTHVPYFYQIFRFIFTKFAVLYAFCFSVLLAFGVLEVFEKISKIKFLFLFSSIGFLIAFSYYSLPSWQGNFLYKNFHLKVPKDYFLIVNYFKKQNKNGRIATFPQPSFWGWTYTNWGYKGSGFLWYGLPQSTLDGAFYPWSRENENYYWEITQALYSGNPDLFEKVLEKYQVTWLVVDHSIVSPFSQKALFTEKLEEMVKQLDGVTLEATFGKINVYGVRLTPWSKDFVFLGNNLPTVGPGYKWNNYDKAYLENGNYVMAYNNQQSPVYNYFYPFRSLFTGRRQEELEFQVEDKGAYFSFKSKIPKELTGGELIIPPLNHEEITEIDENDLTKEAEKYPQVFLDGEFIPISSTSGESSSATSKVSLLLPDIRERNLEIRVPKIGGYSSYDSDKTGDIFNKEVENCDPFYQEEVRGEKIFIDEQIALKVTAVNAKGCLGIYLPNLSNRLSYLITVKSRNITGKSLFFWLENLNSKRADLETYLPKTTSITSNSRITTSYFIQPPMENFAQGYSLHFDNISIGRVKTINDLGRITVNPIPYRFLTSLKVTSSQLSELSSQNSVVSSEGIVVDHPNPSLYQVTINKQQLAVSRGPILVLSQSYDPSWRAYEISNSKFSIFNHLLPFIFAQELKNHILVNNWENGWVLDNAIMRQCEDGKCKNATIILIYLPQYLEYLGFGLLFLTFPLLKIFLKD